MKSLLKFVALVLLLLVGLSGVMLLSSNESMLLIFFGVFLSIFTIGAIASQ